MDIINQFSIQLVHQYGLVAIFLLVFAEAGLFIGVILPGDTLLILAGVWAAQGKLNLFVLLAIIMLGAIMGDNFGYFIGNKVGQKFFQRDDGIFFKRDHLHRAKKFFDKYGALSVFFGRFIGYVRTFIPTIAGIADMKYKKFFAFNALGAISWTLAIVLPSYLAGRLFPRAQEVAMAILSIVVSASIIIALSSAVIGYFRLKVFKK